MSKLYNKNILNIENAMQSLNSWIGHSSKCNSYHLQQKIINSCDFLFTDKTYEKIEKDLIDHID